MPEALGRIVVFVALPFTGSFGGRAMSGAQTSGVEFVFVAKMVIDGGNIDAGAFRDVADGGGVKPEFGEDMACGIDETSPWIGGSGWAIRMHV
jgi:hypothetical protein